jgi:hypothetical protein
MRRFKLINANGVEFDMNNAPAFFQNPGGLGFSKNIESMPAGYDFIETNNELDQKIIPGEMVFKSYEGYAGFISFCSKTPLVLCYAPSSKWYYISCKVQKIDKPEIKARKLICPIDFLCLSTWYEKVSINKAQTNAAGGKEYPYTYDYTYIETSIGSVEINNTGVIPSPSKIHIFGEAINPSWALIQGGLTIATGRVNATIDAGKKLVVDSSPSTIEIAEYTINNVFVRNLYQLSDFSTERFLIIPVGPSIITFSNEGLSDLTALVEVKQLAETV